MAVIKHRQSRGKLPSENQSPQSPKIKDFVEWELAEFRRLCNFTPDELRFFELRSKDHSLTKIEQEMHFKSSKISELSKSVKRKMFKVLPLKRPE